MFSIEPDHVIDLSEVRTQLIRLKNEVSWDWVIQIILELRMILQSMDGPILCEDRLNQRAHVANFYFVFPVDISHIFCKFVCEG